MKKLKLFTLFLFITFLSSCFSAQKLQRQGKVLNKNFYKEVPIQNLSDIILIPVRIENETYNFIFDTGAELNVIDEKIASRLNLKSLRKGKVTSSNNSKKEIDFVKVSKVTIADIEFAGSVAAVLDLSAIAKYIGCTPIHGIIGNNLMRRANWQIDYKNNLIRLTDDMDKFTISDEVSRLKMDAGKNGNILFDLKIGDNQSKFIFDTGYNGRFKTGRLEALSQFKHVTSVGTLGANIVGEKAGEKHYALVKNLQLQNLDIPKEQIDFENGSSSLIGNKFWKNYLLTIDWKNDELILESSGDISKARFEFFELTLAVNFDIGKIEIIRMLENNSLASDGLIGSQVLKIKGKDVSNLSSSELCEYWKNEFSQLKKSPHLDIEIYDGKSTKKIRVSKVKLEN